jgi:hypothetical protein
MSEPGWYWIIPKENLKLFREFIRDWRERMRYKTFPTRDGDVILFIESKYSDFSFLKMMEQALEPILRSFA